MKTLTILTALILSITLLNTLAHDGVKKATKADASIALPAMNYGNPEEVNAEEVKGTERKNIILPVMNWGTPEELDVTDLLKNRKRIALPEMVWGTPEDLDTASLYALKIAGIKFPAMNWGNPEQVDVAGLETSKIK